MKINLTLDIDETRFQSGGIGLNEIKQILYSGAHVKPEIIKILRYDDGKGKLKICGECKTAFYDKNNMDETPLCPICFDYFTT